MNSTNCPYCGELIEWEDVSYMMNTYYTEKVKLKAWANHFKECEAMSALFLTVIHEIGESVSRHTGDYHEGDI